MQILIVDLGSQYTSLIARRLRELGVRSIILPPRAAERWADEHRSGLKGIIYSGGGASIRDLKPEDLAPSLLAIDRPRLGICLGMHLIAESFGGHVGSVTEMRGYGEEWMHMLERHHSLFSHVTRNRNVVCMSHSDSMTQLPPGFRRIAQTEHCAVAAMASDDGMILGVQFHPEVEHTECGSEIFRGFLALCGAVQDWQPTDAINRIRQEVAAAIGPDGKAILAFSGGRDSTILAATLAPALGDRLSYVAIDTGALPAGETEHIRRICYDATGRPPLILNCSDRFISVIVDAGVEGNAKRLAFRRQYIAALEEIAAEALAPWLIQGTALSDAIESAAVGEAERIVLHHNLGLETSLLRQLHPFAKFFKDEIQDIGRALGLPPSITERKPFPGPGYFIRIIGAPVSGERLQIVRWADQEVRRVIAEAKLAEPLSQLVVALNTIPIGNVKGDRHRPYAYAVIIRGVQTSTFMTARGYKFPDRVRDEIKRAVAKHPHIVDAWFAEGDKPPARIEFQ